MDVYTQVATIQIETISILKQAPSFPLLVTDAPSK